jgi:DNA-binding response OmpR family regulator
MFHKATHESNESRPERILLVEDNAAAGQGLTRLLEAKGYAVTAVSDGQSALRELAQEPPPDFLLTDMQLPDLDGRELARHASRLVPPPRVVLITGWDLEPLHGEQSDWGIDVVLTKPLDMQELLKSLTAPPPLGGVA